ncbi:MULTISPECIES: baseplate J/gp47 family protein [unclassified Pantoea]|uniref:baseplate J/gp47 family protein n=1 Tax=unclassified Pantoea TaxID=2630326 RepID=UPI001CD41A11|nr:MULTISPECIES: baseplate J/gp47 family protein [unclassified Pantoea]MCA1179775.1 baseplate J/gp47 family protein [Pantoea sp. alder69]MCA1253623.1 baseplate J/gp47 family protein [Pantoea sp. alder70]MCA1268261.1 baseplate J/gp47 family protein [Pantoea sp. alder81]
MASLNIKSFKELYQDQKTAVEARAARMVDFSIGSILRSLAESNAGVASWLQQLIVKLLVNTRASTCSGEDLDSWMADFNFERNPAVQAIGTVTFRRFTASHQALIPIGTNVKTIDDTQFFTVVSDTKHKNYDPVQRGYVLPADQALLDVPVRAWQAGLSGNVRAGTVTVIIGSVSFVDTVTNLKAFEGGADAEKDDDFRARFVKWFSSLSKATKEAIEFAILHIQSGVSCALVENYSYAGKPQSGYFFAVVDDGTGKPSQSFIKKSYEAIEKTRGFTVGFGVFPPVIVTANVSLVIETDSPEHHLDVLAQVKIAIEDHISRLTLGQLLSYTKLIRLAYNASPRVSNVTSVRLNNGNSDLAVSAKEVIRAGVIEVQNE